MDDLGISKLDLSQSGLDLQHLYRNQSKMDDSDLATSKNYRKGDGQSKRDRTPTISKRANLKL